MNGAHAFVAERPVARHCAALVGSRPGRDAWLTRFEEAGRATGNVLSGRLAGLLGGDIPLVVCGNAEVLAYPDLMVRVGGLAANCLFQVGGIGTHVLTSVGAAAALALTDRTFGGRGEFPDPLPRQFPLSAELTLNRLEKALGAALHSALEGSNDGGAAAFFDASQRSDDLRRIRGFGSDAQEDGEYVVLDLSVRQQDHEPWSVLLATSLDNIASLFADQTAAAPSRRGGNEPDALPFGDIPLPVRAVLTNIELPLSRLSHLRIGDTFALSVPRCVPLSIGDTIIGQGAVGTQDDRVAIRLEAKLFTRSGDGRSHEQGHITHGE